MSQIHVRQIVGTRYSFVGQEWWYEFGSEIKALDEHRIRKFIAAKQEKFATLTKDWNDTLNTEWVCRIFFSAKMILAASLMLQSLEYARKKNLKVSIPYLQYYSLLYSLKALVVVLPEQAWKNASLMTQSHTRTINVACDEIAKLDSRWTHSTDEMQSVKNQIQRLKAFREFVSYRAPSSGGAFEEYGIDVCPLCKTPVELAQMVSEILENSVIKNLPCDYEPRLVDADIEGIFLTRIGQNDFYDGEDHYRIDYLSRKYPMPANILHIMSEGHVEDFFGSWCDEDGRDDVFDPDNDWGIIFDVP